MKKFFLSAVCLLTYATGANANEISICNFDTVFKEVKSDFFKRIWINETVTDTNGNVWHFEGYIDVSFGWGGVSINSYNVLVTCNGNSWHFVGKVHSEPNSDGSISNKISGTLTNKSNNETVPMDDSFKEILIKLNNSVLNNQE